MDEWKYLTKSSIFVHMNFSRQLCIEKVREFNRFYTNTIEVLDRSILDSGFSLAEARVLFEVRRMKSCSAREILQAINIDEGYLSRILGKFVANELISKARSTEDKRQYYLRLTTKGIRQMELLDTLMVNSTGKWIDGLTDAQLHLLLESMENITQLLTSTEK